MTLQPPEIQPLLHNTASGVWLLKGGSVSLLLPNNNLCFPYICCGFVPSTHMQILRKLSLKLNVRRYLQRNSNCLRYKPNNAVSIKVYVSLIMHYFVKIKTCKCAHTTHDLSHCASGTLMFHTFFARPPVLKNFRPIIPCSFLFQRFAWLRKRKSFICIGFYINA
jgi:hypothetical protein